MLIFLRLFYGFFFLNLQKCQIYHLKLSEFSKFQNLIMRQACGGVSRGGAGLALSLEFGVSGYFSFITICA